MTGVFSPLGNTSKVIPVIILNWNGGNDTIECLKSVKQSAPAGFVPVLVDNGSNPESLESLKYGCGQIFASILYINEGELTPGSCMGSPRWRQPIAEDTLVFVENGENLGFAKGNNAGIRFAESIGAEWVMLLNNDTVVSPDAFQELRKFLRAHPSVLAVTPQIRYYSPNTRIQNCGGDLTLFGSQKYRFADMDASVLPDSDFSIVTFLTGCALLFNYKAVGTLSEDFFFGEEDYELSLRMRKLGLEMACVHRAVVYHRRGVSRAKASKSLGAILVYYENRLINTRNYYSKLRWYATKMLAYLYLPVLFARKGIDVRHSIWAIRRVESYVKRNRSVPRTEFQSLVTYDR